MDGTFALIHGGGSSGWDWHLVEPELRALGHDVVAPDLPIDDPAAGLAEFADSVVAAIGHRCDIVVVGYSYGGFTAPLVAEKVSARLLVFLAGMIPAPGESPGQWWGNAGFVAPEGLSELETYYGGATSPVIEEAFTRSREQVSREWDEPWPLAALPDVPTRVLLCRDDRFFTPSLQKRVARERLGIEPDEIDGPHGISLTHPAELAARLASYVG